MAGDAVNPRLGVGMSIPINLSSKRGSENCRKTAEASRVSRTVKQVLGSDMIAKPVAKGLEPQSIPLPRTGEIPNSGSPRGIHLVDFSEQQRSTISDGPAGQTLGNPSLPSAVVE